MKVLITGSNGLLGQKLVKRCLKHNINFIATSKGENRNPECPEANYVSVDLQNANEIIELIGNVHPNAIIHTAAITNVDYCEDHPEECHRINVESVRTLFELARKQDIHFQLLSTDFVFNGEKGNYSEIDEVDPLSTYAKSKVDAEHILRNSDYDNWSIARTIIVYGTGSNLSRTNMVLWALSALPQNQPMNLVNDQFRAPTWADDLAYGCMEIVLRKEKGIFHLSGPETLAVSEIVRRIAKHIKADERLITEISSSTLNQAAKRPPKTGFNLAKSITKLDYHPKSIEQTIDLLLNELAE